MGLLKKMGKAMGHAVAQAGRMTAAAIKRKNLQNKVKRMILDRFTVQDLKRMIKEYGLSGPEMPDRGYYKKEDYVNYVYHNFKLKTVIDWAKRHRIKIKDIMDYYIAEMERIDREYGKTKAQDKMEGVEDIELSSNGFEAPSPEYSPPVQSIPSGDDPKFEEILSKIERDFGKFIRELKITDEREFKNQLYIFLKSHYPEMQISQQVDWRADLLLDGKYALELKYADNTGTLDKGVREIKDYRNHTNYIAVIMLDVGDLNPETIEKYTRYYEEDGARVIVLHARGGRRKKKKKGVYVEIR